MNIIYIIYFIVGLSILILFHEFGHFLAAKIFNVYVYEFSLFMGPKLIQFQIGETKYTLRLLPIGGYCSMAGEEDSQSSRNQKELEEEKQEQEVSLSDDEIQKEIITGEKTVPVTKIKKEEPLPEVPLERSMLGISNWKKIIIMAAGAFNNILLCFILLIFYYGNTPRSFVNFKEGSFFNAQTSLTSTQITEFQVSFYDGAYVDDDPNTEENEASKHFQGSVYNTALDSYNQLEGIYNQAFTYMFERFQSTLGLDYDVSKVNMTIEYSLVDGDGNKYKCEQPYVFALNDDKTAVKSYSSLEELGMSNANVKYGFFGSIKKAFTSEIEMSGLIYSALGQLFTKEGAKNVTGVIGMYTVAKQYINYGFNYFVFFLATISVNLGIMNLLPFPALDGGRIILTIVEMITKKKVPSKVEGIINTVGFILLMALTVVITFKDIFFPIV